MDKLVNPCEDNCKDKEWCDKFDESREHIECVFWLQYQARLDERKKVIDDLREKALRYSELSRDGSTAKHVLNQLADTYEQELKG